MNLDPRNSTVTVFGAAGPTGLLTCLTALAAGYAVRAVSRRDDPLPQSPNPRWLQVKADAVSGAGVEQAVAGADAVLSTLGTTYQRGPVTVYSAGTRNIVQAMRAGTRGRRLVVVSSGLTYEPPRMNPIADTIVFPLLRNVLGRTLYADMRRMDEDLRGCDDINWTVLRPGRLVDGPPTHYRLDPDESAQGRTTRADLAAAMVAELGTDAHVHRAMSPTTGRS